MSRRASLCTALLGALALTAFLASPASAAPPAAPAWSLTSLAGPSHFMPGEESGLDRYEVFLANNGGAPSNGSPITIVDTLPAGLGVKGIELRAPREPPRELGPSACETKTVGAVATVTCRLEEGLPEAKEAAIIGPAEKASLTIHLIVPEGEEVVALTNRVEVQGGGAAPLTAESHNETDPACKVERECAPAGLQRFVSVPTGPDGLPAGGAASHPYQYMSAFAVNLNPASPGSALPFVPAGGDLKRVEVALPPGLIANPTATARCTAQQFNTTHGIQGPRANTIFPNECPDGSAVGIALPQQLEGFGGAGGGDPLYSLVPPPGMPAQFGFQPVLGLPIFIDTVVRQGPEGLSVRGVVRNITEAKRINAAEFYFWGTPADPSHDPVRGHCAEAGGSCPANLPSVRPSFRLPSSCDAPLRSAIELETWTQPAALFGGIFEEAAPSDCEKVDFSPRVEAKPTTDVADAPSGLHFDLHLPQAQNEDPEGLGEADLRDATVTLPAGLVLNPSAANGRAACSPAQIGLQSPTGQSPPSFDEAPVSCPDAAKVGSVEVDTPLLDGPVPGAVYLATPHANPFGSLLAIYIVLEDPRHGITIKLAGKVSPDPTSGQLTTTVQGSPQVPFEDFKLDFFEGARAPLRTPATCGTHTTTSSLKPWSAPASGPNATPSDSFQITTPPAGAAGCPTSPAAEPNSPSFEAGTAAPVAGAYSPFTLRLARADGSQEIKGIDVTLPPGLTGRLAGLAYCSDGALASAAAKSGHEEQASPSCPGSSELGSVTVGAGAGPAPFYAQGKAYLAGPYKGAPLSMAVITPAVAGPFDLGTVVVRSALQIDPETARIRAVSDPIPSILQGIPLDVRSIALHVDRPGFTLNPTSCDPFAFSGQATSVLGQATPLVSHFQVGGCQDLSFKPKLDLRLKGGTKRGDHPAFTATLTMPEGGANIATAQVALPHSEFLDQAHIKTICTRVQFAANACPKGAIYGFAKAWTPLLDQPLEGPVYLRSSSHKLPDLVADLDGQIHVVLHGRTDSIHGGIRNTFEGVPDAPASKFILSLKGGKRGLLINSRDICKAKNRATATFTAQSAKVSEFRPVLRAGCGGQGKGNGHKR